MKKQLLAIAFLIAHVPATSHTKSIAQHAKYELITTGKGLIEIVAIPLHALNYFSAYPRVLFGKITNKKAHLTPEELSFVKQAIKEGGVDPSTVHIAILPCHMQLHNKKKTTSRIDKSSYVQALPFNIIALDPAFLHIIRHDQNYELASGMIKSAVHHLCNNDSLKIISLHMLVGLACGSLTAAQQIGPEFNFLKYFKTAMKYTLIPILLINRYSRHLTNNADTNITKTCSRQELGALSKFYDHIAQTTGQGFFIFPEAPDFSSLNPPAAYRAKRFKQAVLAKELEEAQA
jgi:hypothetical protein